MLVGKEEERGQTAHSLDSLIKERVREKRHIASEVGTLPAVGHHLPLPEHEDVVRPDALAYGVDSIAALALKAHRHDQATHTVDLVRFLHLFEAMHQKDFLTQTDFLAVFYHYRDSYIIEFLIRHNN